VRQVFISALTALLILETAARAADQQSDRSPRAIAAGPMEKAELDKLAGQPVDIE